MSRGRGRGRGRGKPFAGLESLLPGEPPPPPILTPPPLFPPMEKRPLELRKLPTDTELLALKENLRLYMQQSPFALKAGPEKQGIRRYSDKYIQLLESESNEFVSWRPDWRFFPGELRPGSSKRRRVSSGPKPVVPSSRKRARSSEGGRGGGGGAGKDSAPPGRKKVTFADGGERVDPLSDVDESVTKEKGEEEGEGEEGEGEVEEEVYDEEVEEEDTDYNMSYFDNGEDYGGNESDALEEGPCY
ncbi:DNA-directed RNA polymerase III subunit RPC7 [Geodia barretti]|uniref:DNA-directed RNA polymerase III subunit RPC7 n=1 Tax=Geodia barretti TaxID=519541 RepID=A0AA35QYE8_GEOBA|nr:DNA-directed RNA polymerase III subunit RPC7 [Geodia barretti]